MSIFSDIDPTSTSGNQLATLLNSFKDSIAAGFKGTSRDANAVAGHIWVDETNDPVWDIKMYDGATDITVLTVNTSTNVVTFPDVADSFSISKASDDSLPAILEMIKSRLAGDTAVDDGDTIAQINIKGYDDTSTERTTFQLETVSSDDFTSSAYGSYTTIKTVADASSTLTERVRFNTSGHVAINEAGTTDLRLNVGGSTAATGLQVKNAADSATPPVLRMHKSRIASSGQVNTNDVLGRVDFATTDDTGARVVAARIISKATENTTTSTAEADFLIQTVTTGSTTLTDKYKIDGAEHTMTGNLTVTGNLTISGTTTTLNTSTLDVEDANITVNNGGNQATADSSDAGLTVEMSDATDATIHYDSTATSKFKVGEVGSTVEIADISSAQVITNKDINGGTASNTSRLTIPKNTKSNLDALTRKEATIVYATDHSKAYIDNGSTLTAIGSGEGGGLDVAFTETHEINDSSTYISGNNATVGAGGTIQGTLANETSAPINGATSIKFTVDASSANDYWLSEEKALSEKYQNNFFGYSYYSTYDGDDNDIRFVVYDETNDVELTDSTHYVKASSTPVRNTGSVYIPDGVDSIRYGWQVVTANAGSVFTYDDVTGTANPFVYKNLGKDVVYSADFDGSAGASVAVLRENVSGTFGVSQSATGVFLVTWSGFSVAPIVVASNSAISGNSIISTASVTSSGCTVYCDTDTGAAQDVDFSLTIVPSGVDYENTSEHVITPAKSTLTNWEDYTPTTQGIGTISISYCKWRRVGDSIEVQAKWTNGTTSASELQFGLPNSYTIGADYSASYIGNFERDATTDATFPVLATANDSYVNVGFRNASTATSFTPQNGGSLSSTSDVCAINFKVRVAELTSNATFLAAIPTAQVAWIKDVKTSGTNGGNSSADTTHTRTLNTLSGDSSFISLSSNQFTLPPGKYVIHASAPAVDVNRHQAFLYDVDNTSYVIDGSSEYSSDTELIVTRSIVEGVIEISSATTYEIRHWTQQAATPGLGYQVGVLANPHSNEVYTIVRIEKVK